MRLRFFNLLATLFAIAAGLLTLFGYFSDLEVLQNARLVAVSTVSLLAAWAVLAGGLNLLMVHGKKFLSQSPGWMYSVFVYIGFLAVIVVNLVGPLLGWGSGAGSAANSWLLTYLIGTGGAALAGLVAFFLVYAAYRLLRTRPSLTTAVFGLTVVVALVALAPWPAGLEAAPQAGSVSLRDLLRTATLLPATAGARGLLLGVALGTIATGLRLLMGLDRPYGD
ncbi:MAG: hypothetical protein IT318_12115 [Anaerolineales bacterium]|nr:hypothetical protein [Anaerolineales bacterium]